MSTPLEDFFAQFANLGFTYSKNNTAHNNFKRLRKASQWDKNSTALTVARVEFNDALVQEFNFIYGTDSDLAAWQNLCEAIDILPIPDNIEECQKVSPARVEQAQIADTYLKRVWDAHVNIVDLLESARTGTRVQQFTTLEELRVYTKQQGKMFPKESAYTGGLLKELLREIINEYFGKRRNGSAKRKRRKARRQAAAMQAALEEGSEA
ncbi:hypothetical protein J3R82DRAFT_3295 [Butyriboletus roseoflavus]|nr:hypothetical protein J3R82DRAFT_3295 [Butyriboletus roseoflavus]